jgi:hypothetical protein
LRPVNVRTVPVDIKRFPYFSQAASAFTPGGPNFRKDR